MKNDFLAAFNQICSERNLPKDVVLEAIEAALILAYKRHFSSAQNVVAKIDSNTGKAQVFIEKTVVEHVQDDRFEISLDAARLINPQAEIGQVMLVESTPREFGRIAAQTAKQVILQRIREAERDVLFSSYAEREGEIINGTVQSITPQAITLNLGRTEAILPRSQQVPGERYHLHQRVRAYVLEVRRGNRGPQIVVSRTHKNMLRRLLELEVPEIYNGIVEIKAIAREAGSRSKVAVAALQEGVDPVGSCVGMRGVRIQSIVNELGGEKIDVVEWSPDTATFIANALSPAKVSSVLLDEHGNGNTATVIVPDDQLSLAIGREGQNARLAAKLTGWRIDIKSASEAAEEAARRAAEIEEKRDLLALAEAILLGKEQVPASTVEEATPAEVELVFDMPIEELGLSTRVYNVLAQAGITEVGQLIQRLVTSEAELLTISGLGPKALDEIKEAIQVKGFSIVAPVVPEPVETVEEAVMVEEPAQVMEVEPEPIVEELSEPIAQEAVEVVGEVKGVTVPVVEIEPAVEEKEEEQALEWEPEEEIFELEEDDFEEEVGGKKKKKERKKKRVHVYGEVLGEVGKRRRKPGRQRKGWEDYID
ncbi:MAG: transcription termination factor NusA [Anaerolineae bacterium]|nr:transcription termination factor NusA [Anaerolineae bacterium]MDH7474294.1 transcription termination factor NusA [Anaerolineae bacterium]